MVVVPLVGRFSQIPEWLGWMGWMGWLGLLGWMGWMGMVVVGNTRDG